MEATKFKNVFFFEEGMQSGGVGERFSHELTQAGFDGKFYLTAVDGEFVAQATVESSLHKLNLDAEGMEKIIAQRVDAFARQEKAGCSAV